ncbi:GlxA family transcriptional regulator [Mycolicibacterium vaccae]|uniref:GlxA family transcriptional regulator n=1 Tax=Mycolicibacterium vaccae TaxID=1810 RepID=UPI003CFDB210
MCHYTEQQRRRIAMLVFDGSRTLDVTGPLEAFDVARALGRDYSVSLHCCGESSVVRCSSGLSLAATPAAELGPIADTLVIVGGDSLVTAGVPQHLRPLIQTLAGGARRVAAIGTGSFALASAGLLDGRRATTHWRHLDAFAAQHPAAILDRQSVYTRDGDTWTSAGAAGAVDLALALIAEDNGTDLAHEISRDMVLLSRRLDGHPQISAAARTPRPKHAGLERLMATVSADPAGHYELETVAAQIGMSPRHLARLFKAQVGVTLRQYVYEVRLENAVGLVLAGESFHAAAQRSGLRYGARIRDHLQAHRVLPVPIAATPLLVDAGGAEAVPVYAG